MSRGSLIGNTRPPLKEDVKIGRDISETATLSDGEAEFRMKGKIRMENMDSLLGVVYDICRLTGGWTTNG